ncbi:hypothetical protein LZ30DRAFT_583377, partial [Colletotrichum cereale]
GAADRVPCASSSNVVDQPRMRGKPMLEGAALLGTSRCDANASTPGPSDSPWPNPCRV